MGTEQRHEAGSGDGGINSTPDPRNAWWFKQPAAIDRFTGWLVLWTAFLFAANVVTNVFIWQQWKVANASQVDTREQLRAVVTYQLMNEFVVNDKDGKPIAYAFQAQFYNSGGTRTAFFRPWVSIHYFDNEVPNNLDLTKPWSKFEPTSTILGGNSVSQMQPVTITANEADKVRQKQGVALIWGHADYADIFQPNKIHLIDFCLTLESITTIDGKSVLQPVPYKPECNINK